MKNTFVVVGLCVLSAIVMPGVVSGQYRSFETDNLRLIYYDLASDFLVKHVARSFHNSLDVYEKFYGYTPDERVTMFIHDAQDYGNAGADVLPRNFINLGMAPLNYAFEMAPANERINSTLHHELVHVVTNDHATSRDKFFRSIFSGKVAVSKHDPLSVFYSYLTAPRRYAPRWYQEGIAVFMETWMSGQIGRSLGGYDEMVFRTRVLEGRQFYDKIGLETEGTADFQVGVNSYLYGTRFMSYLALQYSPEKVVDWMNRPEGSKASFMSQFKYVFDLSMSDAWANWIQFEKVFQLANRDSIRVYPVTEYRNIASRPLGSMSKAFVDTTTNELLAAVRFPGKLSYITGINLTTGKESKKRGITGPTLLTVSSVAFDAENRRVFYSNNNNRWRDLAVVDLETGDQKTLIDGGRIGDLAFNRSDGSLWGVRHSLGFSTLVRIPAPYDDWDHVDDFPYGRDIYDIDISPDGVWLTGAVAEINGDQSLVRARISDLLQGKEDYETLFAFDTSNPEGFVFSPDGSALYGSSYFSGVSNILKYNFADSTLYAVTNGETGYFRPIPLDGDSLIAFRFTSDGFQPVMIPDDVVQVKAVDFLGQRVIEEHPVVLDWMAPPPSRIDLDEVGYRDVPYKSFSQIRIESMYPILRGYKDYASVGLRVNLSDPLGMHRIEIAASVTPTNKLPSDERFHGSLDYSYLDWSLSASYNRSFFYDLFGPTIRSARGGAVEVGYNYSLSYDGPRKNLSLDLGLAGYFDIERLPDFQNVLAPFTEMASGHATLAYKNVRSSLGAVDTESGFQASLTGQSNFVNNEFFPRVSGEIGLGYLLPASHISLWLRGYAGASAGEADNPFANYFFGGFRNNYVDDQEAKQYQRAIAFPGLEIDEIRGNNFAKVQAELILPPLRLRHIGGSFLFLKWIRLSVFSTAIITNLHRDEMVDDVFLQERSINGGAQLDMQIMLFSYLRSMISIGGAVARKRDGSRREEFMVSLKIL